MQPRFATTCTRPVAATAVVLFLVACGDETVEPQTQDADGVAPAAIEQREPDGLASYYSNRFAGRTTANGESYEPNALTAAHRSLPFGTRVRVTNVTSGDSVVVRINDRGPFVDGRVIDLSRAAAEQIDLIDAGVAPVELEIVSTPPTVAESP